jgi:hypothetical protein
MMKDEKESQPTSRFAEKGEYIMKKLSILVSLILVLAGIGQAAEFAFAINARYFSPKDSYFKDIYGGGMAFGGEFNVIIAKNIGVWINASYFSKAGQLTFTKEDTNLSIIPIGIGACYRKMISFAELYGGLGLIYAKYKETAQIGNVSSSGIGYLGKIGANFNLTQRLFVDLFVHYSSCKMKPADFDIDIGGFEAGIGIGYKIGQKT